MAGLLIFKAISVLCLSCHFKNKAQGRDAKCSAIWRQHIGECRLTQWLIHIVKPWFCHHSHAYFLSLLPSNLLLSLWAVHTLLWDLNWKNYDLCNHSDRSEYHSKLWFSLTRTGKPKPFENHTFAVSDNLASVFHFSSKSWGNIHTQGHFCYKTGWGGSDIKYWGAGSNTEELYRFLCAVSSALRPLIHPTVLQCMSQDQCWNKINLQVGMGEYVNLGFL